MADERILILPFALASEGDLHRRDYLSRQLPVLVRNAVERSEPGKVTALPLAAEDDGGGRSWVLRSGILSDEQALGFAAGRDFSSVVFGAFSLASNSALELHIRVLACEGHRSGELILEERIEGDALSLTRAALCALAPLLDKTPEELDEGFVAGTTSAAAWENYMEGLDQILEARAPGIDPRRPETAMEPFDRALLEDPAFEDALTAGLSCALQAVEGDRPLPFDSTHKAVSAWIPRFPKDARVYAIVAEMSIQKGDFSAASERLEAGLAESAEPRRDLLRRLADVRVEQGELEPALNFYEEAQALGHEDSVLERMASLGLMLGRSADARSWLESLAERQPGRSELWARIGVLAFRAGENAAVWPILCRVFDEGGNGPSGGDLTRINHVLAELPPSPEFRSALKSWHPPASFGHSERVLLGRALRLAGTKLEAKLCLESVDPERLSSEQRTSLARERLNLEHRGFDDRFAEIARVVVTEMEQPDMKVLSAYLDSEPEFWPARFLYGLALARDGEPEQSALELKRVVDQQPKSEAAWYTLGLQYLRLKRCEDAADSFTRAIELNGEESSYHSHLALSKARMSQTDEARDALARALELRPDARHIERIQREIDGLLD